MFGCTRTNSPIDIDIQKQKSHLFAKNRENDPSFTFQWATVNGDKFNQICEPDLSNMTDGHCSFCDLNDLGVGARFTIDHFRSKTKHPLLSHIWINLYPACDKCQESKMEVTNKLALRPDDRSFRFEDYFIIDTINGNIVVIPNINETMKTKAEETISYYGLNLFGRPTARKTELKKMISILGGLNPEGLVLNDFSYRYMWS